MENWRAWLQNLLRLKKSKDDALITEIILLALTVLLFLMSIVVLVLVAYLPKAVLQGEWLGLYLGSIFILALMSIFLAVVGTELYRIILENKRQKVLTKEKESHD